jgi:hypothetical protein
VATPATFNTAWRMLDQRSTVMWWLLLGSLPGMFASAYVLNDLLHQDASAFGVVFLWMAAIGWAGLRVASFACPRCGGRFFENWYFFKPLRANCAHCNLSRNAKTKSPAG